MTTKHLIVPGMAKAGTTFLFDQLERQPGLFNAPRVKELNYLTRDQAQVTTEGYMRLFPNPQPDRIYLDASPVYLQSRAPLHDIVKRVLARRDVKFIITVRDPIKTMWSHYLHDLKSTICPINRKPNPRNFSLFNRGVLKRYFKDRSQVVTEICKTFPGQVLGLHMTSLFQPDITNRIGAFLDISLTPFVSEAVSNPGGWLPYYRYGGRDGQEFVQGDTIYELPPRALLLVSNNRSALSLDVSPEEAVRCMELQSTFTRHMDVPISFFEPIIEDYHRTCDALGITPEPISAPERVVSEATSPTIPEALCAQLKMIGPLDHRAQQVFTR